MTTDSQISSTVDPIEFMDEEALMKLKLKHMRAEQCRTRTHKMYKLFLDSATDPKKKENLEHMLLATINNLDRKMSKFQGGLDDYDQKEQYILVAASFTPTSDVMEYRSLLVVFYFYQNSEWSPME